MKNFNSQFVKMVAKATAFPVIAIALVILFFSLHTSTGKIYAMFALLCFILVSKDDTALLIQDFKNLKK